jgi:hypothetical protein
MDGIQDAKLAPAVEIAIGPPVNQKMDGIRGAKLDVVITKLGTPDSILPASFFGAKFEHGIASVVMTYRSLGVNVYLTKDCTVLGILDIKE